MLQGDERQLRLGCRHGGGQFEGVGRALPDFACQGVVVKEQEAVAADAMESGGRIEEAGQMLLIAIVIAGQGEERQAALLQLASQQGEVGPGLRRIAVVDQIAQQDDETGGDAEMAKARYRLVEQHRHQYRVALRQGTVVAGEGGVVEIGNDQYVERFG